MGARIAQALAPATPETTRFDTVACARMRAPLLPPGNQYIMFPRVHLATLVSVRVPGTERYLTLVEVSRRTGLEQSWLRRLCQRGDLPAVKAGRDWLVTPRDLGTFERRHKGRPPKSSS